MKRGKLFYRLKTRFRKKRVEICDALLRDILKKQPEVSLLDTGGRPAYREILAPDLRDKVRITCPNVQPAIDTHAGVSPDTQSS